MPPSVIVLLRATHVIASSFWLGATLMNAGFLIPAVLATGPAGGQVMRQLVVVRRLPRYFDAAMLTTLVSGGVLLWWILRGFGPRWAQSATAIGLLAGAGLAVLAAVLGQMVNAPTARRLGQVAAEAQTSGGPPSEAALATIRSLQLRLLRATVLAAVLLSGSAILMAAARYLG